jgi:hypothetical protein
MRLRHLLPLIAALLLTACAGYAGRRLQAGVSTEAEVRQEMGVPARQWDLPGGGRQLAYPRGPEGYHTFMVYLDAGGRFERTENVLDMAHFARIRAGMTEAEVLQLIGPPQPQWELYFAARDERVWEWRYCDSWREVARFSVLFDGTSRLVRSTLSQTEGQITRAKAGC